MRGQPDFGAYQTKSTGATLADMADLAVRLGIIVEYDRRGDVVKLDDFESPVFRWESTPSLGGAIALDIAQVKSGAKSVKLSVNGTAGASPNIKSFFYPLGSLQLGAEISFCKPATTYKLRFEMSNYTGTAVYYGQAEILFNTGVLQIRKSDGTNIEVATGLTFRDDDFVFSPMKMVIDFLNNKYTRFLLANVEYDLSAHALSTASSTIKASSGVIITLIDTGASTADLWLDDFVFTQNEP